MKKVRWGIIGCGNIARTFVSGLKKLSQAQLVACAASNIERANSFAQEHSIAMVYGDYQALASSSDVDAVYIATTHNFHYDHVKLCLEHGKHVLCEKPFTINTQQAKRLMGLAKTRQLFLMEAVWTRFLPIYRKLEVLLAENVIGEVLTVKADFCIQGDFPIEHRIRSKALAGGALLDLGIYPINLATLVFQGYPRQIQSSVVLDQTGVDARSFYLLDFAEDKRAMLSSSYVNSAPFEAIIYGDKGYIRLPDFIKAEQLEVYRLGKETQVIDLPFTDDENFVFEIKHAMACINAGKLESDIYPLSETLKGMQIMDDLRKQWGLVYPQE